MPDPISWEQWQIKAKDAYKKGVYTKKEMVRDWGFPSDLDPEKDYILFDKGKPYIQDYQKRLERKRNSSRTRSARNVTSTNLADHLNKAQSKEHRRILDEASMFALDDPELSMMVEHGVPVSQYHQILEEGAPDDPSNKYIQRTVDGIAKTDAEKVLSDRGLDKQFTVIDHEDFGQPPRLVPVDSYNPHEFPSNQGVPIDNLDDLKRNFTSKNGQVHFDSNKALRNLGFLAIGAGILSAGQAFAAGDTQEGFARLGETALSEAPVVGPALTPEPTAGADMSYPARAEAMKAESDRVAQAVTDAQTNGSAIGFTLAGGAVALKLPEFGLSELLTGRYGNGEAREKLNGNGQKLNGGSPRSNGRNRPTRPS